MKLIDGHAMIQRVEVLHKRGAVDLAYFNIVKEAVQMEPAVDAIPVAWLEGHKTISIEDWGEEPVTVGAALMIWQKEQEAR